MKKILLKESRSNRQTISFNSLYVLSQLPSEMLKLPTSPLKVAFQFVDANVMSLHDGEGSTALHWLTQMSDPSKEHTLENQYILAKQLDDPSSPWFVAVLREVQTTDARLRDNLHPESMLFPVKTVGRSLKIVGQTWGFRQWMAGLRLLNQSYTR
jgi:hypothetical protein